MILNQNGLGLSSIKISNNNGDDGTISEKFKKLEERLNDMNKRGFDRIGFGDNNNNNNNEGYISSAIDHSNSIHDQKSIIKDNEFQKKFESKIIESSIGPALISTPTVISTSSNSKESENDKSLQKIAGNQKFNQLNEEDDEYDENIIMNNETDFLNKLRKNESHNFDGLSNNSATSNSKEYLSFHNQQPPTATIVAGPSGLSIKKNSRPYSKEEDELLIEGVRIKGENWKDIIEWAGSNLKRQPLSLQRRFKKLIEEKPSIVSSISSNSSNSKKDSYILSPPSQQQQQTLSFHTNKRTLTDFFGPSPNSNSNSEINGNHFSSSGAISTSIAAPSNKKQKINDNNISNEKDDSVTKSLILSLQQQLQAEKETKQKALINVQSQAAEILRLKQGNENLENVLSRLRERVSSTIEKTMKENDKEKSRRSRELFASASIRVGKVITQKSGIGPRATTQEYWENGYIFQELQDRQDEILKMREELEKKKKMLTKAMKSKKNIPPIPQFQNQPNLPLSIVVTSNTNSSSSSSSSNEINEFSHLSSDLDFISAEEALKVEIQKLKNLEQKLLDDTTSAEIEKVIFIREMKRLRDEDASRFNRQPTLNNRYLLRFLLGKGGFSEVWHAYDLQEFRDVAVKVHELNPGWSQQRKASYFKHAMREYKIHINLSHHHIVRLFDVFEIDSNSFATVLEFCDGTDLDLMLKKQKIIPEKEAKAILLQILLGLKYLNTGGVNDNISDDRLSSQNKKRNNSPPLRSINSLENSSSINDDAWDTLDEQDIDNDDREPMFHKSKFAPLKQKGNQSSMRPPCIIHYDLKPGNILFDKNGNVKITDFGLSKIVEPENIEASGIELTSQGAGTYWYLPPECFKIDSHSPPKISSKVDVWSVGVIFYQMLFGKRPFGEGMSQDRILSDQTMLRATRVEFPEKSSISQGAKDFITSCLTYDQDLRPDVITICNHSYLYPQNSKKKSNNTNILSQMD